jgi:GxxExxY protein
MHDSHKLMKVFEPVAPEIEALAKAVVDCAYRVHVNLGPGLLESVYETCLSYELKKQGIAIRNQVSIPIVYDNVRLDADLRIDLLVGEQLIVEIKAVAQMNDVFKSQLITYLKLTGLRLGLLINFNVPLIKNGIQRIIL